MGVLIDTCIWIDVEQGRLSPGDVASITAGEPVYLSPITLAELAHGAELASDPDIRQKRLAALLRLRRKPTLLIDGITGEIFGDIAAQLRRQGRHHRYRVQDVWLASQAIQHGYGLLTRNARDFEGIPGLELVLLPS